MKLDFIDIGKIDDSAMNMRSARQAPDVSDILPTICQRGILVPVILRPAGHEDRYELVAGRRRVHAARTALAQPNADPDLARVPAAIMEAGDDAAALEASLIENIARLDPDEVTQWETFVRLVKQGRTTTQIAITFGLPDLTVRRVLALGNLLPRIRDLYRAGEIDVRTVRHLTLASKARQRDWLKLHDSEDAHAPTGSSLRAWLLGGADISTKAALFPLDSFRGRIVTDLFGEHGCFADADLFWTAQNEAIAARIDSYRADGWQEVELIEPGRHFHAWEYEKTPKAKGGRVYVTVRHNGEVEFHEGYLTGKEAAKARAKPGKGAADEGGTTPAADIAKPETTTALQRYLDLHRHAAVRAVLLDHPRAALRLMVAHAIAGSPLWRVDTADQRAGNAATDESLETSAAETIFDTRRRDVLALLGLSPDRPCVVGGDRASGGLPAIFARLLTLGDGEVMHVLAVVMGETLAIASPLVDLLGAHLRVDMAALWEADDAFFAPLRDRKLVNAMLREVAGKKIADAHLTDKVKTQKAIIRDCLAGSNARTKVDNWVPRWLAFPPAAYVGRPVPALERWRSVQKLAMALPAPHPVGSPAADTGAATPHTPIEQAGTGTPATPHSAAPETAPETVPEGSHEAVCAIAAE